MNQENITTYPVLLLHSDEAMTETEMEPVDILVVEDNDSQRSTIVASLEASIRGVQVAAVHDGDAALDFLFGRGEWVARTGHPPPKLILLDLEMPGTNSFSVLGQIRSMKPQCALTLTPIVVFTDSKSLSHIQESYRCGASSYILKPLSFNEFKTIVDKVGQYWMTHNQISS